MKLNHDCVRDLMIYIEENVPYGSFIYVHQIKLDQYEQVDLIYTADKLCEARYIKAHRTQGLQDEFPTIKIDSLTWEGHNFLDTIRDITVWERVKEKTSVFASVSLPLIAQLGTQILSNMLALN